MSSGNVIPPTYTVPWDIEDHEWPKARVLVPLGIKYWRGMCGAATRAGEPCRSRVGIERGSDRCHAHRGGPLAPPPFDVELVRGPAPEYRAASRLPENVIPFPARRTSVFDSVNACLEALGQEPLPDYLRKEPNPEGA